MKQAKIIVYKQPKQKQQPKQPKSTTKTTRDLNDKLWELKNSFYEQLNKETAKTYENNNRECMFDIGVFKINPETGYFDRNDSKDKRNRTIIDNILAELFNYKFRIIMTHVSFNHKTLVYLNEYRCYFLKHNFLDIAVEGDYILFGKMGHKKIRIHKDDNGNIQKLIKERYYDFEKSIIDAYYPLHSLFPKF